MSSPSWSRPAEQLHTARYWPWCIRACRAKRRGTPLSSLRTPQRGGKIAEHRASPTLTATSSLAPAGSGSRVCTARPESSVWVTSCCVLWPVWTRRDTAARGVVVRMCTVAGAMAPARGPVTKATHLGASVGIAAASVLSDGTGVTVAAFGPGRPAAAGVEGEIRIGADAANGVVGTAGDAVVGARVDAPLPHAPTVTPAASSASTARSDETDTSVTVRCRHA